MKHKGSIMTDTNTSRAAIMRAKCCGMVLHGGHPDPAEVVEALEELQGRAEQAEARVKDLEGVLRDMIEGYQEYDMSNGKPVLQPIEKQSSWIQRARSVLLQEEPKP